MGAPFALPRLLPVHTNTHTALLSPANSIPEPAALHLQTPIGFGIAVFCIAKHNVRWGQGWRPAWVVLHALEPVASVPCRTEQPSYSACLPVTGTTSYRQNGTAHQPFDVANGVYRHFRLCASQCHFRPSKVLSSLLLFRLLQLALFLSFFFFLIAGSSTPASLMPLKAWGSLTYLWTGS
jgi:hypothetical protein